ncbi:3-isopropylmalate dehydrogenase [Commensalibacter oyaizuii]|uniref:3-isopropylmalate dehydrogenase n=1 Tax=Commensalibacter oyaizuii TaxID=3043873 RepID=A0ABT6PZX9_9PROT|nr:3-isopropylmalate dehydrogenase [Commensalibacter sp. TBRC 16381]MDI2090424.1 3-isopropylmalate dehydrogenase [Commensalibacter sp. TBRC 16381]
MTKEKKILTLAGDGIGPEIMEQALHILDWVQNNSALSFHVEKDLVGGASIDQNGIPLTKEVIAKAKAADAVLFGAVGGPKWDGIGFDKRPELGIIGLRKELGLFANLRSTIVFDSLVEASTIKPEVIKGLDIMIVRESTGGVYFGEPRGIETLSDGTRKGVNTEVYTSFEIERIARVAFDLARQRQGHVCSVEKSNVMESGLLWREVVTELHKKEYFDIPLSHMLADNCAMQLVKNPRQFDIILTSNLFGDILSDLGAMLTGSLGMLPSATLGARQQNGVIPALYEPIHGSAPDIAGQGKANPLALILSLAMMLRYSFDEQDTSEKVVNACKAVLDQGFRTPDIMSAGMKLVGTEEMGKAVLAELQKSV